MGSLGHSHAIRCEGFLVPPSSVLDWKSFHRVSIR
nr:MAG TPA: hypothetical protein [Caudoviricetes sp.]